MSVLDEHFAARDHGPTVLERIDDELVPYFTDDPARCAFPDDGRDRDE